MAEKQKKASPTFNDFNEENLLLNDASAPEKEVEELEEVEEKEEVEKEKPKEKASPKKQKKSKEVVEEVKEDEVEEDKETPDPLETEEKEEPNDEIADAEAFIEEVEKLTGIELDLDYGDTDPLSPQGVALREAAVKEHTLDSFLQEIEEKFPQVFRALKHANNGGDVAELFAQSTARDYSKVAIGDEDSDLAKEILKEYYKSKGVKNEAKIAKMIETDEDSAEGLVKEAKAALEELKAEQNEKSNAIAQVQERKAAEDRKRDQILVTALDEVIDTRDLGGFKIADKAEAQQFRDYVVSNIRKVGEGKYELSTPLDSAGMAKALQYQYFQFKKGDLTKIIRQKVESEGAKKLSLRLKGEQEKFKQNRVQEDKSKQALTLKSYNA